MAQFVADPWYASPQNFKKLWRWTSRSQKGVLEVFPQRVQFTGGTTKLQANPVQSVAIVQRPIPWVSLLLENCALLVIITGGFTSFIGLKDPAMLSILVCINAVILFMLAGIKWVDVEYVFASGQVQHAYFSDGSTFGIGRALGGADKLAALIRSGLQLSNNENPVETETANVEQVHSDQVAGSVLAECESCGRKTVFSASGQGKVERCPGCGSFIDV